MSPGLLMLMKERPAPRQCFSEHNETKTRATPHCYMGSVFRHTHHQPPLRPNHNNIRHRNSARDTETFRWRRGTQQQETLLKYGSYYRSPGPDFWSVFWTGRTILVNTNTFWKLEQQIKDDIFGMAFTPQTWTYCPHNLYRLIHTSDRNAGENTQNTKCTNLKSLFSPASARCGRQNQVFPWCFCLNTGKLACKMSQKCWN